ncbi:MAG TPA: hypothetical protein VM305_09725 [Candidatus Limnocylindrales bacterium]|nr:hypothetical protein [Candidatus Limnocylindrales bacterium]
MSRLRQTDRHARFRQLLAARMDLPLPLDDEWQLTVHLSRCDACRAVEREYREQRRALRQLAPAHPPRDLWARTATALDAEMAAGRDRAGQRSGRGGSVASVAASLSVFGAAALLLMSQLPLVDRVEPTRLPPTPFAVPRQAVAYVGSGPQGLSIYRTSINNVCPVSAADCVGYHPPPATLTLSRSIEPSSMALSPSGRELAISGRDSDRDGVIAIVMMPEAPDVLPSQLPAALSPEPRSPEPRSPEPTTTPVAHVSLPPRPDPSDPIDPRLSPFPVDPTPAAGLAVLAILEDALGVGAPPAWSSDGSTLAFSAMPADGSAGPDLYIWRAGDETALRLTHDQSSYFASWSGNRIVASRLAPEEAGESPLATTVVIDLETGEHRPVADLPLWLPQLNGPASHAVAWHGTLAWRGPAAVADSGALYLVEWSAIDPFADPASEPTPAPEPDVPGPAEPYEEPTASPANESHGATAASEPSAPTFPATLPPLVAEDDEPRASEDPADDPPPAHGALEGLQALDPGRDPDRQPVRDWEVRWSPDGALLGYWIADAPGSSWGRLTVLRLNPETGVLAADSPLLAPMLARRSFSLGVDRLAWVAPAEHNPEGELRVNAWGPDGFGVLRLEAPEVDGAVAPF